MAESTVPFRLIGTSSEASKYTCEFTLRAANGIERISKTFFVRAIQKTLSVSITMCLVNVLVY
jgi:hypothetical protein